MNSYTKLWHDLVTSSLWTTGDQATKVVWITMLALKDRDHTVSSSIPGLARTAGVTIEECEAALEVLASPDKYSRTEEFEGRRISEIEGGWLILNGEKHQNRICGEERREYLRIKKQEERARKRLKEEQERGVDNPVDSQQLSPDVKSGQQLYTPIAVAIAATTAASQYPGGTDLPIVSSKGEESEKGKPPPIGDGGGDSPDKVPETTKPKAKPKAIPEKPPHDRRAVSDAWVLRFKQHTGSDYAFHGAKDGKAISDLLALFPADKIIETIHTAFDTASQNHQGAFWLKKLNSLSMLASRYNEIVVEITELSKAIPKNTMNQGVHLQASQREWSKQIKINLEEQRRKGIEMVEHLKAERLKAAQQPPTPNEP